MKEEPTTDTEKPQSDEGVTYHWKPTTDAEKPIWWKDEGGTYYW